ncbi:hypothetical protein [Actinokineospora sp. NBRC 105648]|uniref:hypothetical protein n=1 Tax=Actinokineospora sp. NBRC 105648 TaxID=3032206 RepID=UPI0024A4C93A|nr:hypothetical protein [Actinokineospora sp. NBRC 105648]GLZ43360.1 hypothetical protein Acsp05_69840 [Actinokineospora sp. NBRC 105648]
MSSVSTSWGGAGETFLRRMLWRRVDRPEPIVALLGPPGSGRGAALEALSRVCGGTVVHANIDFGQTGPDGAAVEPDPVTATALIAFELMRGWRNLRGDPTFHRVGLCLLALNERLDADRGAARRQIEALIDQYARGTREGRATAAIEQTVVTSVELAAALTEVGTQEVVDVVRERAKPVIGALLRPIAKRGLRKAFRWHSRNPTAEEAGLVDSLIALSRTERTQAAGRLIEALLADIEDNAAAKPIRSTCACLVPDDVRAHEHSWVLLVDNADTESGQAFLTELGEARTRRAEHGDVDPLLVVCAADRWRTEWNHWWAPPAQAGPPTGEQRRVPLFAEATHALWAEHDAARDHRGDDPVAWWYPVWLGSLSPTAVSEVVAPLAARARDTELGGFTFHLAAGHPLAVREIGAARAADGSAGPEWRTGLWTRATGGAPWWEAMARRSLRGVVPLDERPWHELPAVVVAAAYLADPWRFADSRLPTGFPALAAALAELREHLWISTYGPESRLTALTRGSPLPALHPWLARCLLAGLATETAAGPDDGPVAAWPLLFGALRAEFGPASADRELFYQLALGEFTEVSAALAGRFDTVDHREWIATLEDVTSAPCGLLATTAGDPCHRLLLDRLPARRTVTEVTVAKLVAALWLHRDPMAGGPRRWYREIREGFTHLHHNSTRIDVSGLQEAALRFR